MESKTHKFKKLIKKFLENDCGQMGGVGTLYAVFFASIILLAIIIIFTFIPGIGSTVEQSTPTVPAFCSNITTAASCTASQVRGGDWNTTDVNNTNFAALSAATGSAIWASTSGMLKVVIIVALVVIILGALFGIFQARRGGGGMGGGM